MFADSRCPGCGRRVECVIVDTDDEADEADDGEQVQCVECGDVHQYEDREP